MASALYLKKFFVEKRVQARALAKEENKDQIPEVGNFFAAGEKGDWVSVMNIYSQLQRGALSETMVWQPVQDRHGNVGR